MRLLKGSLGQLNSGDKRYPQDGLKIPSAIMISSDLDFTKVGSTATVCMESMRFLLLGRKPMTNLDGILKSRDITLPTKSI